MGQLASIVSDLRLQADTMNAELTQQSHQIDTLTGRVEGQGARVKQQKDRTRALEVSSSQAMFFSVVNRNLSVRSARDSGLTCRHRARPESSVGLRAENDFYERPLPRTLAWPELARASRAQVAAKSAGDGARGVAELCGAAPRCCFSC